MTGSLIWKYRIEICWSNADDLAVLVVNPTKKIWHRQGLRRVNAWMLENKLELEPGKTEALVLSDMRRPKDISFKIEEVVILPKKTVKYLGVVTDRIKAFGGHIQKSCENAEKTVVVLSRLMPKVGGHVTGKRAVMTGVVNSILLYAAPI